MTPPAHPTQDSSLPVVGHFKEVIKVEKLYKWLAWKFPRDLVKWASLRLIANATQGQYSTTIVPELTAMDALKRWN